ncbi:MAG: transcription termination/antitermination protein NusA [Clostridiales bacterium GWF2_38_85]|nr:MAG: transcription termination/antitermination protein NusA [Clostridiales bacterium GWF2_38_85]HBL85317.1 transcription termination/antitermination protein NusA [Clostridiales bacterium]
MNTEFFEAIEALDKERGIPKEYMLERVEAALVTAYKRESGGQINVKVVLDSKTKSTHMYKLLNVVEEVTDPKTEISLDEAQKLSAVFSYGDIVEIEVQPKGFGRIPAQTAKQVIIQAIREAERGMLIKEYESKKDEIVSALVVRIDPLTDNATLEIGKNEMVLFRHEQIANESLKVGDRLKVFVTEIKQDVRGPSVVLSRTHPGLIKRLFELEVPEIAENKVEIMSVAREAGSRTKIAVRSNDSDIDPIGACIGPKRIRKTNISDELNGEKIDIIKYSSQMEEFIAAALAPAKVKSVVKRTDADNAYRVIVDDDQLSLAIGKAGQNARLASKLVGCKIDIKSDSWLDDKAAAPVLKYDTSSVDVDEDA